MVLLNLTKKEVSALNSFLEKVDYIDSGENEFDKIMKNIRDNVSKIRKK